MNILYLGILFGLYLLIFGSVKKNIIIKLIGLSWICFDYLMI